MTLLAAVAIAVPLTTLALTYEVTIEPVDDELLADALRASSNLLSLQDDAEEQGVDAAVLLRQIDADEDRFGAALRSEGYYSGSVSITVDGLSFDNEGLLDRLQAYRS